MNQLLAKIPRPLLVLLILCGALVFFVLNDPIKDECDIQAKVFDRNTKGILKAVRKNKKIQFAQITSMRDLCKEGNSMGSCADYFDSLGLVVHELKLFKEKCQLVYAENNESFVSTLSQGMQIMALVAWGEKPPAGLSERFGWFTEVQIKTFCGLKKSYLFLAGEEAFLALRNRVYSEYPDAWPEPTLPNDAIADRRKPENRPRALKTAANPLGKYTKEQVFERSLFSTRCDMYL
jgi:hypothetical protein